MDAESWIQIGLTFVLVWVSYRYARLSWTLLERDMERGRIRRNRMAVSLHQQAKRVHAGTVEARNHIAHTTSWQSWRGDAAQLLQLAHDVGETTLVEDSHFIYDKLHEWEQVSERARARQKNPTTEARKREAIGYLDQARERAEEMVSNVEGYMQETARHPKPKPWWRRWLLG